MKKVYLIYESSGSFEDYNECLIHSTFDKDDSDNKLNKLRSELYNKRQRLLGLEVHLDNCLVEGECEKCDEYWELKSEMSPEDINVYIEGVNGYIQKEIEVLEKGEW